MINLQLKKINTSVGELETGAETFYREPEPKPVKKCHSR